MTEARDALAVALGTALVGEPATEPDAVEFLTQRADAILAALPDGLVLARRQDAEDGAALRELREALPDGRGFQCGWSSDVTGFYCHDDDSEWGGDIRAVGHGPTIAAAARKAREALR